MLKVLENPIRRKIIECLSQEPTYCLQLSKNLRLGQQSIAQHLEMMEKSEIVYSDYVKSPSGPKRKIFKLAKSFSIILDVAPHLFKQNIIFFSDNILDQKKSKTSASILKKHDEIVKSQDGKERIEPFSKVILEIDDKLEALENERVLLLSIRNSIMSETSQIIIEIDNVNARRVFHQILDAANTNVKNISSALNLREENVKNLLQKLKKEFLVYI